MTTAPTSTTFATPQVPIHFSTVFDGGKTPVACGKTEMPLPATPEWRYVTCRRCLECAPIEEHQAIAVREARRAMEERGSLAPLGELLIEWGAAAPQGKG